MELELHTSTGSRPEKHKPIIRERGDATDLSSDSFAETDLERESSEGDESWDESAFEGERESGPSRCTTNGNTKSIGIQTEWSWMTDIVAYAHVRGINIKELEQLPHSEPVRDVEVRDSGKATSLSVDQNEQCDIQENVIQDQMDDYASLRLPEIVPTEEANSRELIQQVGVYKSDIEAGTPTILKYVRESELPPRPNTVPCDKQLGYNNSLCRVCNGTIPLNKSKDLPSLYCTICSELIRSHRLMKRDLHREITMIDIRLRKPAADKETQEEEEELLSQRVNTKVKRRLGREKAMARMKEQEILQKLHEQDLARQRVSGLNQMAIDDDYGMYDKNMKTISYSLSSQKCMDKGWTLQPKPTPIRHPDYDDMGVEMRVDHFTMTHESVMKKEYQDGKPFLLFMPDGTGQCYYPSGIQAVCVSAAQYRQFTYVIQSDLMHYKIDETVEVVEPQILASFTPSGYACCFHSNGIPYLIMTPTGGAVYATDGSQKKKWLWNSRGHCHSPPLQPLCLSLSKYLTVRISSQENIVLTFSCHQRTARFVVGWKGPLRQDSSLSSRNVDSQASYLKSAHKHITGLLIAIQETEKHPKTFSRRVSPNVMRLRTSSAPGKLRLTKSSPTV